MLRFLIHDIIYAELKRIKMKINTKAIVIVVALAVVALVLYAVQASRRSDSNTLITERGYMVKSSTAVGEVWALEYDSSGKAETISLFFDSSSLCIQGAEVKTCNPSDYLNGQGVQVEGFVDRNQFFVTSMQVLDEVKPDDSDIAPATEEDGQL